MPGSEVSGRRDRDRGHLLAARSLDQRLDRRRAGVEVLGEDRLSPSTAARCSALQARAHGLAGDQAATAKAMKAAEVELNKADLD
ncbi:MAG: hypothetical protein QOH50_3092, partial [Kribbellaceae bacterium]|nr:hypothetical protein [Kribbellaceae bacterium]